jgi:hypothetical protein
MKFILAFLCLEILTAGCNKVYSEKSPTFEIRDLGFQIDKAYGSSFRITGRGTVVVKEPELKNGSYFLLLKEKHAGSNTTIYQVIIKTGVGVLNTFDLIDSPTQPPAPKYEWEVIGFVKLQSANLDVIK